MMRTELKESGSQKCRYMLFFLVRFGCASFWPDAHWMCMFFAPSCFYRPAKANGRRSSKKKTKQARLIPFNETVFIVFVLSATIFRLHSRHHTANSEQPRTISLTLTHSRLFLCGAHDFRALTAKWVQQKKTIKIFMVKLKLVGFGLVCVHSIEICLEYAWCYITDAPCRSLPQKPLNSKMNHACVYFGLIFGLVDRFECIFVSAARYCNVVQTTEKFWGCAFFSRLSSFSPKLDCMQICMHFIFHYSLAGFPFPSSAGQKQQIKCAKTHSQ